MGYSPWGCKESGTTEQLSTQHIYTFFYWVVCFFVIEPHELFAYFADELFVSSFICKYFLPFCGCLLILFMVSLALGGYLLCGFVSKKDL